jgi:hypothetical protein
VYRWPLLDDFAAPNRAAVLTLVAASGLAALYLTGAGLAPSLLFGGGLTALPVQVPALYHALAAMPDDGLVMDMPAVAGSLGRLSDGEPRRMMGPRASVVVRADAAGLARLAVRASSYARPMTLEVRFDGRTLVAAALPVGAPADLDLGPVRLLPGANVLELRSLDGCVVPDDLDPRYYGPNLDGIGYRCVSFAVERIALDG